jgi:hypothetical protein
MLSGRKIVWVVLLTVIGISTLSAEAQSPSGNQPKNQPQQTQSTPAPDLRGTEQQPLVIRTIPSPGDADKAAEDERERKEKAELDRKLVDFNGDLAFYTKILALLAGIQLTALFLQTYFFFDSVKVSKSATEAARVSATAAKQTADSADAIGRAQTRAYISIKSTGVVFFGRDSDPLINIVVSNGGQTPARDFKWEVSLQYYFERQIIVEATANREWLNRPGVDIPPRSEVQPESKLTLNMSFKRFVADTSPPLPHVAVRIKIEYRSMDVFGKEGFGEAYFSAMIQRNPPEGMPKAIGLGGWGYSIFSVPRPDDWDLLRDQQRPQNQGS